MRQPTDRRMRTFAGTAAVATALLALPAAGAAQEPTTPDEPVSGREHRVRRGDTLWDLAGFYFENPFLWGVIFEANRDVVEDPHWIYPDERLIIPGLEPLPADAATAVAQKASPAAAAPTAAAPGTRPRTRFYAPGGVVPVAAAQMDLDGPERTAPQVRAGEFHASPWLMEPRDLEPIAEVVAVAGREGEVERLATSAHPYDALYLRRLGRAEPAVGDRLLLVTLGRDVHGWGRIVRPVAMVTVSELHDDVFTATVNRQFDLLEEGVVALPMEQFPGAVDAAARPVDNGPEGVLIAFEDEQPLPATRDRAFISLGRADGLEVGDELIAYLPQRSEAGVRLPAEQVARLRVLRVRERSATVQVVSMAQPSLRPGLPVQLVAKRP